MVCWKISFYIYVIFPSLTPVFHSDSENWNKIIHIPEVSLGFLSLAHEQHLSSVRQGRF